ncbi:MAG: hypothetical protein ASARMPRED_005596 [Alectoria sarmentosa]|nr:MAG: hypothetical protein ASARMPRED_005596 [Alectoria sarmentosa]
MRDFNGQTASFQSVREPGYDDFYITMKVKAPATQVQTRIAVWGLYAAISNMQIADNFVEADFDLTWDGSKVASLRLQTRDTASAQSMVEGQGTQNQSLTLPPLNYPPSLDDMMTNLTEQTPEASINATSILKDQVFEAYCEYLPDAETLTFEEVLIPIIRVLQSVAAVPKTSLVDSAFETGYSGVDSRMQFGGPTPSGAVQPPYYQYKWIIKGVNAIPFFLLEHGRSAELTVGLVIDDPKRPILITNCSLFPANPDPGYTSVYVFPQHLRVPKIPHTPEAHEAFVSQFINPKSALAQKLQAKTFVENPEDEFDETGFPIPDKERLNYARNASPTILICGHNSRDSRCGILGPLLHAEFTSYVDGRTRLPADDERSTGHRFHGLQSVSPIRRTKVALTSHIGGHAFAGNVVIYLPKMFKMASGKVSPLAGKGIWYGRVEPRHVWGIMEETVQRGRVIEELLRGIHEPGGVGW